MEDAPFVGALISAIDCKRNCPGCFNQQLKNECIIQKPARDIIDEIVCNPFHQGIIFGGLDWLLQPKELEALAVEAHAAGLQTMLYAGCEMSEVGAAVDVQLFDYIKTGSYREDLLSPHIEYGVTLSTSNQHIIKL